MKHVLWKKLRVILMVMSIVISLFAMGLSASASANFNKYINTTTNAYNFKVIDATSDFYVNDFAGLFTAEQKDEMMQRAIKLDEECGGIQVVVTTVKTLDECVTDGSRGKSIDQISIAMYNQYGIGQDDMGILILFASEDREVKIDTGHAMQAYITDGQAGELLDDYGMDYFVNDQFADGLVAVQEAVVSKIQTVVPSDWNAGKAETVNRNEPNRSTNPVVNQEETNTSNGGALPVIQTIVGILIIVLTGLYLSSLIHFRKERKIKEQELQDSHDAQANLKRMLDEAHVQEETAVSKVSQSYESKMRQVNEDADRRVATFQNQITGLNRQLDESVTKTKQKEHELCQMTLAMEALKEKYSRIKTLHPDIDFEAEVQKMIEDEFKARASALDKELAKYVGITPDKEHVSTFYQALQLYKNESHEVYRYLKTDINHLQRQYDESKRLKAQFEKEQKDKRDRESAKRAYDNMMPAYGEAKRYGATYKLYDSLKATFRIYTNLSEDEKRFFPDKGMINELRSMLSEAEADSNDKAAARNWESEVERVINYMSRGSEDDVDKLERLVRRYNSLNMRQQKHVNSSLIDKLKRLLREAKDDHDVQERRRRDERERRERREREERDRRAREDAARRARMSSSSSFGSSHSSFSGHGGRSSGGGASRHF